MRFLARVFSRADAVYLDLERAQGVGRAMKDVDEKRGGVRRKRRVWSRRLAFVVLLLAVYCAVAYALLPYFWMRHDRQPGIADRPMVTRTGDGIAGDPLNVGLVGDEEDVLRAMHSAGWLPADPVTLRSSLAIIGSVLLDRADPQAPVSALYYDGRREDVAFEKAAGTSARRRHHVRFWKVLETGAEGRPVWLGAATFDAGVGLSRYTGQVTHAIAPDIDTERETVRNSLTQAGMVEAMYEVAGVGPTLDGRNGEGNRYATDGELAMMVLVVGGQPRMTAPDVQPPPPLVAARNAIWQKLIAPAPSDAPP